MKFVAFERAKQGTGASRRLRISGKTPGIVYGGEGQPQLIELDHNALWHALKKEAFHSSILEMEIAGNSTKVGSAKLAAHSRAGAGSVPRRGDKARPAAGSSQTQIRPQSPMTASNATYTVRGDLVRRITRSRANAPSASPAKKPATAPSTDIISLPSARLNWRVHTIS